MSWKYSFIIIVESCRSVQRPQNSLNSYILLFAFLINIIHYSAYAVFRDFAKRQYNSIFFASVWKFCISICFTIQFTFTVLRLHNACTILVHNMWLQLGTEVSRISYVAEKNRWIWFIVGKFHGEDLLHKIICNTLHHIVH